MWSTSKLALEAGVKSTQRKDIKKNIFITFTNRQTLMNCMNIFKEPQEPRSLHSVFQMNRPRQRGPVVCPKLWCAAEQHCKALSGIIHCQLETERLVFAL